MDPSTLPDHADPAHAFVVELLRTGLMLSDLLAEMLESTSPDAFPGEEVGEVLLEMLAGTVRPAVEAAGPATVAACSALLGALGDRTVRDLEAAAALAQQRHAVEAKRRRRSR